MNAREIETGTTLHRGFGGLSTALVALLAGGCSGKSIHHWSMPDASISWQEDSVRYGYSTISLVRDDHVHMLVALAGGVGFSNRGGEGPHEAELRARNGKKLRVSYSLAFRGEQGSKIIIDGREFSVTEGELFLASAETTPPRITQLRLAASQLRDCVKSDKLLELTKSDPRFGEFHDACQLEK